MLTRSTFKRPKPEVHRNAALLEMARGRHCLLPCPLCQGEQH